MTAATGSFKFDPFFPGPRDLRPAVFAELRAQPGLYRTGADLWVAARFDDVKAIQSQPELFSSRPNPYEGPPAEGTPDADPDLIDRLLTVASSMPIDLDELATAQAIASADPPEHTRVRRIVSRGFTPGRITAMATTIAAIVDRCMNGAGDLDGFDVVERLAVPLPVEMIANILGIESAGYDQVKQWSDDFAASAVGDIRSTPEGQLALVTTLRDFALFYVPLIEERRAEPKDDVISAMLRAVDDEALTTVETLTMAITIMVAGNETSTNLIGNAVVELLSNPEQLELLSADPSVLPAAVDEANRLTAPIQIAFREATEDVEVAGTAIAKGDVIALHMAAANRDPQQFDDPDRFDITRPRARHLSFGHGVHFCLGSHLALQEVTTALGALLPHLPSVRLADAPLESNPSAILNGWRKVELVRN
ncbi:MAG TPA: cytochrome P450 [Mycobacteriales bacterium]|jgi:cytochrome P450|nr:cytochrome P450 [Mycobacteriales bacterium]